MRRVCIRSTILLIGGECIERFPRRRTLKKEMEKKEEEMKATAVRIIFSIPQKFAW